MKLKIEALRGTWVATVEHRTVFADTLEELLLEIAPDAPEEYVWHTAEVLGAILGAEVVELEPNSVPNEWADMLADFLSDQESWQPTDAQQAYFTAPEIADAHPDAYPRGV